jgi:hypothetical protein
MRRCETPRVGGTWYCRAVGCPCCRAGYRKRQQRRIGERFEHANREDMSLLTVMFSIAYDAKAIGEGWNTARRTMNNLVVKQRQQSKRWRGFDIVGWLEADPILPADLPILDTQRRSLIESVGMPSPRPDEGPHWFFHMHAVVHHPRLAYQDVRFAFESRWPAPRQVHVSPFYDFRSKEESLNRIIHYATKYEPGMQIGNQYLHWHPQWLAEYSQWAFDYSQSYKSMRFSISGKYSKKLHIDPDV